MKIKKFLKEKKIKLKKYMGQSFLINEKILRKIVNLSALSKKDTVLEVGAGIGNLTEKLLKKAARVIAVEKDRRFIKLLKEKFKNEKRVLILEKDILKISEKEIEKITKGNYKIVANLPYYLSSRFLKKFLEMKNPPKKMILTVQKELALRICGKPKNNLLSIISSFFSRKKILLFISKKAFWPKPKVDSALLKIEVFKDPEKRHKIEKKWFFKGLKAGFSHPRKKLLTNLNKELKLDKEILKKIFKKMKIREDTRAEMLSFKRWLLLLKKIKNEISF